MRIGETITIRYSKKLAKNGHSILANRTGKVTRIVVSGGNITGVNVDVEIQKRTRNYFIPTCAVEGLSSLDEIKNLQILHSAIL